MWSPLHTFDEFAPYRKDENRINLMKTAFQIVKVHNFYPFVLAQHSHKSGSLKDKLHNSHLRLVFENSKRWTYLGLVPAEIGNVSTNSGITSASVR